MKYILKISKKTKKEFLKDLGKDAYTKRIKASVVKYTPMKKNEIDYKLPNGRIVRYAEGAWDYRRELLIIYD